MLLFTGSLTLTTSTTSVVVGEEVRLTCTSDEDLKSKFISWTRIDTQRQILNQIYINNTGCYPATDDPDTNYTYSCGTTPVHELCLTIPSTSMTENQNGIQWRCAIIFEKESNNLILSVAGNN